MSQLRIYYYNGRKMLVLVRNHKQKLQKVAGGEELYSCSDILQPERKKQKETERYVENIKYRLPYYKLSIVKGIEISNTS